MRILLFIAALLLFTTPSFAIEDALNSDEETMTIVDYIDDFVDIPAGGIDWKLLGTTEEIESTAKDEEGFEYSYTKPKFTPEVEGLNGKEI
ncbi:MAG: hypothetical protein KKA05_00580, partial [Alphaproteobacteria bacterium]|nr:hypothetical protein [Alphaproteobacteria bacterium]